MAEIPSRDWNPFLWAGSKLRTLEKKPGSQGLRTQQAEQTSQIAGRAGGILDVHMRGAIPQQPSAIKKRGHKAWLGPVVPAKPGTLEGIPSVRINPVTKKIEAHPGYQEKKARIQHFNEAMESVRSNPHRAEFMGGM